MSPQHHDRAAQDGHEDHGGPPPTLAGPGGAALVQSSRAAGWFRRHPTITDACWVLPLMVLTGADLARSGSWADVGWQTALWLPVIFRRKAPVVVFIVVGVVSAAQWQFGAPLGGDLAVLVVLYTVAAHRSRILAIAAAAAVQVGVVLAVLRFGADLGPRFLLLLTVLVITALSLGITQQARRSHLAALTDRADRLERESDQQAQLAAAAERTRIAREMHDIVAHSLAVMITLADGAALTYQPDQARSAMRQVARTGREALADTRRVLEVLHTDEAADPAPLPGIGSIEALLTTIRATGLHTRMTVTGTVFPIPEAGQLAIYRIVQEALTNTLKHANLAESATVRLSYDRPQITVDITDDGSPDDASRSAEVGHASHGLLGIEERAALFNGHFAAGPTRNGGWRVSVTLRFPAVTQPDPATDDANPALLARPSATTG